jgi:hypothetical protein
VQPETTDAKRNKRLHPNPNITITFLVSLFETFALMATSNVRRNDTNFTIIPSTMDDFK